MRFSIAIVLAISCAGIFASDRQDWPDPHDNGIFSGGGSRAPLSKEEEFVNYVSRHSSYEQYLLAKTVSAQLFSENFSARLAAFQELIMVGHVILEPRDDGKRIKVYIRTIGIELRRLKRDMPTQASCAFVKDAPIPFDAFDTVFKLIDKY